MGGPRRQGRLPATRPPAAVPCIDIFNLPTRTRSGFAGHDVIPVGGESSATPVKRQVRSAILGYLIARRSGLSRTLIASLMPTYASFARQLMSSVTWPSRPGLQSFPEVLTAGTSRPTLSGMIRRTVTLLILAMTISVAGCAAPPANTGRISRDGVVAEYLDAVRRQDATSMASLLGPGVDAREEIAAVLRTYGGLALTHVTVGYLDEFGGSYVIATVAGTTSDGSARELEVRVSRIDGRYFLALGEGVSPHPVSDPASPQPMAP
jgi:hypothetical protein